MVGQSDSHWMMYWMKLSAFPATLVRSFALRHHHQKRSRKNNKTASQQQVRESERRRTTSDRCSRLDHQRVQSCTAGLGALPLNKVCSYVRRGGKTAVKAH